MEAESGKQAPLAERLLHGPGGLNALGDTGEVTMPMLLDALAGEGLALVAVEGVATEAFFGQMTGKEG